MLQIVRAIKDFIGCPFDYQLRNGIEAIHSDS